MGGWVGYRLHMNITELKQAFATQFASPCEGVVQAPGRVNLIGEHTDYNDGFVLPIAIEMNTTCAWAPRDDGRIGMVHHRGGEYVEADLCNPIEPGGIKWGNFVLGVAKGLADAGVTTPSVNLLFDSNVPLGSGLSSSASLEMAAGMALLQAAGTMIDRYQLAKIGQIAEHTFIGTPCGIMDQAISVLGEKGQALLLDCRDGATRNIPFNDPAIRLLVCNTEVKHELNDGGYARRRDQCYAAAKVLDVPMLRDVSVEQVKQAEADGVLRGKELMRARHVVGEIDRTLRAVAAMEEGDLKTFGAMMVGSHSSLRDDYEVSCDELDLIVDTAITLEGVYGARMTGGGFGGCAIVLARADQADTITETIQTTFNETFGHVPPVYITTASQGASIVE